MGSARAPRQPCENRGMGYFAALTIAVLVIIGCVVVFRRSRSGL
jgi:hypothetical protein